MTTNDATEADARIHIDLLLRQAGWDPTDKRMVRTEVPISFNGAPSEVRDDPSFQTALKIADYVLYSVSGRPLAVIEAKRSAIDPYRAKDQALAYARAIGAPFVEDGVEYSPSEFERKRTNARTNELMMREFDNIEKQGFVIYDFFKNHEYFGDSDEHAYTGSGMSSGGTPPTGPGGAELIDLNRDDTWRERVTYVEVGPLDTRIDKDEYRSRWEQTIREAETSDPVLAKIRTGESSPCSRRAASPTAMSNSANSSSRPWSTSTPPKKPRNSSATTSDPSSKTSTSPSSTKDASA